MYQILEYLATHGLGDYYYPMPEELLQTGRLLEGSDWRIYDVRDLYDGENPLPEYKARIHGAITSIKQHQNAVICCGAGQSRSNAIALGVLVQYELMDFFEAWELIKEKVPICQIEPCHISALKKIFGVTIP